MFVNKQSYKCKTDIYRIEAPKERADNYILIFIIQKMIFKLNHCDFYDKKS